MIFHGLTDSAVSIAGETLACGRCGLTARIANGLCVSCMLEPALEGDGKGAESLAAALAEIDVRDADWRAGNYQILEEIGRGGMGVIYRARQRHSRRIVALKRVLSYHADSRETLARFRREAEAAASLDHPNILPIYEVSVSEDGLPFFSMKFAPGGSLLDCGPILRDEPRRSVALMAKVARAVQYAHGQGILHRDLKPGNILLDGRGEPLVSDFGLAKWLDTTSELTRSLTIFGTPGYIAPEQAKGPAANLTPAADVYSLGAILFNLFTGQPPFLGEHALAVIQQAADKPAPKLRTLAPSLDRDLETICARCLEREPHARYRSAGDMAEDLERWLDGRPIIARPVSPAVRIWRWSRRNPKLAGSIAACLVASATAAVWQIQSRHLASTVREQQLAAHSTTVLPFLDLDNICADGVTAKIVATTLQSQISKFGLARVIAETQPSAKWTGGGILDEVQSAARRTGTHTVLSGTVRHVGQGTRVSLHLISENGTDVLGKWMLDVKTATSRALAEKQVAAFMYKALDGKREGIDSLQMDPTMKDETARGYFNAGRGLLDRRTIADMDRAIACFEAAIRAAPRSVAARSYLAMAYMGRNYLLSSPQSTERAYQAAREAIALAPEDPTANRGLCYVAEARGRYAEALEFGLRTIELGDQSERAFGEVAYAWKMLGRPDKAILWYRKAKASNQQPADYDALLGDCFADLGLDDQARLAYETATNFRPDLPEGWMGLVYLKLINGDLPGARNLFRTRSQEYASFPVARQLEALVEFFSRNYAEAERLYAQLSNDDPIGIGAQHYGAISYASALARLRRERKDVRGATDLINKCISSDLKQLQQSQSSDSAEILYRLAADQAVAQNATAVIKYLNESIARGWLDSRSPKLDPRFDVMASNSQFKKILDDLAARVADLRRQSRADKLASTINTQK
jgi:tetratricopeptide (TPR) repeat protein/tRNA A-37 threonylcarbamoyl transferase component Bud32/TolB-like protein